MSNPPAKPTQPGPKKAADFAADRDWPGYYKAVLGKPARETLVAALDSFEREAKPAPGPALAIDIGCGEGRDTLELLRRSWRVLAIDDQPKAFDYLRPRVPPEQAPRLEIQIATFQTMQLPGADLMNASYALPFCEPRHFPGVWAQIVRAIRPGGRFAGQLFGDRDDWSALPDRTHHTRPQAEALFRPFEIEMFKEEEKDDTSATGGTKHWQIFHIVAKKR
jgi:tellurite methyltransferase